MMVFGIVFAAQVGMALIPFKQAALTVFSAYETMAGTGIDYAKYMLLALIICALCSALFILMGKFIFRPDMSKLQNLDASRLDAEGNLNLSGVQKTVLVFLFLLVGLLLAPNFLPADFFLTRFLKSIGNTGIVILLVTVMACIKVEGKPLLASRPWWTPALPGASCYCLPLCSPCPGPWPPRAAGLPNS